MNFGGNRHEKRFIGVSGMVAGRRGGRWRPALKGMRRRVPQAAAGYSEVHRTHRYRHATADLFVREACQHGG
jgi:hypothetical protein